MYWTQFVSICYEIQYFSTFFARVNPDLYIYNATTDYFINVLQIKNKMPLAKPNLIKKNGAIDFESQ